MSDRVFSLSALSIRRHVGVLVLAIAVIVLGLFFISTLQVDLLPSITYPRIGVRINTPGIAPDVAIDEITKPLEESLAATEGVVQVYSRTREGRVAVDLFFRPGGNVDQALNDATATLNRARGRLPEDLEPPRLFKFDPSQLPIYEMALTSPTISGRQLRSFAEFEIARELTAIPGVSSVDVSGASSEEIQVNLDLNRMQSRKISVSDVLEAIRDRNQDISGGRLGGRGELLTRTVGQFESISDIEALPLNINRSDTASPLYLKDVAEVVDTQGEQRVFVNLNGNPAIKLSVQKQPEANTVQVIDEVKARLLDLERQGFIPADMETVPTFDESTFIRSSITNVAIAGVTGSILAAIAVLLFLGSLRQTLIIILAIPLASFSAIVLMRLFNLSLNIFSLGGLALGVGIVVDNSIVMLESIVQGVEASLLPGETIESLRADEVLRRSQDSAQTVESALIASTSTNLIAVLPFLLIGGFMSLLFNELLLTISFAIAASILVALTVVPMLTSRLLTLPWSSGIGQLFLLRAFQTRFEQATVQYQQALAQILKYRWTIVAIAVLTLGSSSYWMLNQLPQEILPPINTGQVNLNAQLPKGSSLTTNLQVMDLVDTVVLEQPETKYAFSIAGGSLFASIVNENPRRGSSTLTLQPKTDLSTYTENLNQKLRELNLVDIRLRVSPRRVRGLVTNSSPLQGADIDVVLQGEDPNTLEAASNQVLETLDSEVTSAEFRPDNESTEVELQIQPDWERASALDLDAQAIGETIQTSINGTVPSTFQRQNRLVDIRVQIPAEDIATPSALLQLPLFTPQNQGVRLLDIAQIRQGQAPTVIRRINQRPVYLIAGNLAEGARLSTALDDVDAALADLQLPPGILRLPSRSAQSNRQLRIALVTLGGLAIFLVFVVMAVQYNSLLDPFVILLTVPLALAGSIFGLYFTATAVGATVLVGVILLVGIVVNNAIILIELANQLRVTHQLSRRQAILNAAPQRLRPILMTTATTVLGLFPLALGLGQGSEFLQPLGIVVFAGLGFATLLTLFIIPCLYLMVHEVRFSRSKEAASEQPTVKNS
ncbi:MAG: efflux RND transporter permease subunit [Cyanobacteria bacterium P01_F01_bin.42]